MWGSTFLLGGVLSSAKSSELNPYQVYSPRDEYVESIVASEGKIRKGDKILVLDTSYWRKEYDKLQLQSKLLDINAERLSQEYVDKYILGPLNANIQKARTLEANDSHIKAFIESALQLKVSDSEGLLSLQLTTAEIELDKARASTESASDALATKLIDLEKERADLADERMHLAASLHDFQSLIELSALGAPIDGTLRIHASAGVFVEKGDLLFEIV